MTEDEYYNRPRGCEYRFFVMIAVFVLLIIAFSCEKHEDTYCYQCIKRAFAINTSTMTLQCFPNDTVNRCDWTEKDAQEFEKRFNIVYLRGTCNDEVVRQSCICEKQ